MYQGCTGVAQKKAFIGRWLANGGSKGDLQFLVKQEIDHQNKAKAVRSSGYMTPGQIATLVHVQQSVYDTEEAYRSALKFVIVQNQMEHPPKSGPAMIPGPDFWTSKFSFYHQGILEETEENTTKQHFSKVSDMNYTGSGGSGAGAMACVNSAFHVIST